MTRSAGLRPASRGSAKPAPTTLGAPVSDRHRAGARNQRRQRLERRSLTGIARERETSADNAWSAGLRPASRGSAKPAPTTLGAPVSDRHRAGARNQRRQRLERRSPTGIARERETSADNAWSAGLRPASRGSAKPAPTTLGAPVSDRHRAGARNQRRQRLERRSPTGIARERETSADNAWSAGLRPASRGSAKPAPTTLGAPVSVRAGARNQRRQRLERRSPTGIARERETSADNAWSAGLRPASRGSAKPAPTTLGAPASSPSRPASRGSAKPAPTTLGAPASSPGAGVSDRHRGPRGPRNHTPPTRGGGPVSSLPPACGGLCRAPPGELPRGRRSLACASLCLVA